MIGVAVLAFAALLLLREGEQDVRSAAREAPAKPSDLPRPAASEPPEPPEPSNLVIRDGLEGRVFDEEWQPIVGAIAEHKTARAITDATGRFVLPMGPTATIRARGYVTASARWEFVTQPVVVVLARGGMLAGKVRDAKGRPVAGAGVRTRHVETVADHEGLYALSDLPAGFLDFMEARTPNGAWQKLARLPEVPVRAGATAKFDPVVLAGVTLSGTAPPGATVLLTPKRARTQADQRGRFRFDGVAPGPYRVRLDPGTYHSIHVGEHDIAGIHLKSPDRATLRVTGANRPGTLSIAGTRWHAEPSPQGELLFENVVATTHASLSVVSIHCPSIALPAGETTLYAIPAPNLVLAGVVEDPDGNPVRGSKVTVYEEDGELGWRSKIWRDTTDAAGRFRVEVRSNQKRFAIVAEHPEFVAAVLRRLEASSDALTLRLSAGAVIEGTVVRENGEAARYAWVGAYIRDPRWSHGFGRRDAVSDYLDNGPRHDRFTRADESGNFRLSALVPGKYWVTADYPECDPIETGGSPVRLIVASKVGGSIAGIVVDPRGQRVSGAIVVAGDRQARADHAGRIQIEELSDEVYDLVAKPQESGILIGPHFVATTLRRVTVGRVDVVMRTGDGRVIRGRILNDEGDPVAGAKVKLLPPPPPKDPGIGRRPNTPRTTTAADGRYTLRGLPLGRVNLVAFRDGLMPALFEAKGDAADDVKLSRGESVSGTLMNAEGRPAAQRSLNLSLRKAAREADVFPWRRDWSQYGPRFDTRTTADGSFRFTGLPAGEYTLKLAAGNDMTPVTVSSGATSVKLELLPLLTITGVVVDENGQPVHKRGHRVYKISANHASGQVGYIRLAEDGSFRFDRVPAGKIRLHVIGWADFNSKELDVEAGAQDVRVQLEPSPYRQPR